MVATDEGSAVSEAGTPASRAATQYLFSDESGDLQFRDHPQVTKYFAVGTLVLNPEQLTLLRSGMASLREDLAWRNLGLDSCYHATTDAQAVRDEVFALLSTIDFRFDVTLLEKRKAEPRLYRSAPRFYQYAWFYHLKYLAPRIFTPGDRALFVAAELGTKKERSAFRTAIQDVMNQCLNFKVARQLAFWRDESEPALQAVDYCTWAVTRMYERADRRSYDLIASKVASEFDIFRSGVKYYY